MARVGQRLAELSKASRRYVAYFKCNRQFIHQFPGLARHTRDVYHLPGARAAPALPCSQFSADLAPCMRCVQLCADGANKPSVCMDPVREVSSCCVQQVW